MDEMQSGKGAAGNIANHKTYNSAFNLVVLQVKMGGVRPIAGKSFPLPGTHSSTLDMILLLIQPALGNSYREG